MSSAFIDIHLEVKNDKHMYTIDSTTESVRVRAGVSDMMAIRRNLTSINLIGTPIRLLTQLIVRLQLSVSWAIGPFSIKLFKPSGPTFITRLVFFDSQLNFFSGQFNPTLTKNAKHKGEIR